MAVIMIIGVIITLFFVLAAVFVLPVVFLLLSPLFLRRRVFSPFLHPPDSIAASGCARFSEHFPRNNPVFIVLTSFFSTLFSPLTRAFQKPALLRRCSPSRVFDELAALAL